MCIRDSGYGGSSEDWNNLVSGSDWLGPETIAETGGGSGVIHTDGVHITPGFMSVTLNGGLPQEAVMDPDLTIGTRKILTQLDLAILRDIGFETVPEPTGMSLFLFGLAILPALRRRK